MADTDMLYNEGSAELPACVFIHGGGMNKYFWADMSRASVGGGAFPISIMLGDYDDHSTLYNDLSQAGHTVITWSQSRPAGPAHAAIDELKDVLAKVHTLPHNGIIIIAHSKGGVIARAALQEAAILPEGEELKGLITLGSPHGGSELARWAGHVSKLTSYISGMINDAEGRAKSIIAIKSMLDFLQSSGVKELLPDSEFMQSLPQHKPVNTYCLSIGGTDPALINMTESFAFPASLEKVIPSSIYPDEIAAGKGDGLVSAARAQMPQADEHLDFPVSHSGLVVDPHVRTAVLERIKKNCMG